MLEVLTTCERDVCTLVEPELPLHLGLLFPRTAETIIYLSHPPFSNCNWLSPGWSCSANKYPRNQQQTHRRVPPGLLLEPLFCTAFSLLMPCATELVCFCCPRFSHLSPHLSETTMRYLEFLHLFWEIVPKQLKVGVIM